MEADRRGIRRHLLALVVIVLVVWAWADLDGAFISDEGSYGAQVLALRDGSWDMGYAFRPADPEGAFQPFHAAAVSGEEVVPYLAHPVWPTAQHAATRLLGLEAGLRVLGVIAVIALAVAAWHIALELGPPAAAPWAFWAAAASPVLANAWLLWAHAPSAALGALLVLACLRADRGQQWALVAALAAAGSVLLRSEGVLWVGAVAVAVVVAGRSRRARWTGVALAVAAIGAWKVEDVWAAGIADGSSAAVTARDGGAGLADRVQGLRIALVDGAIGSEAAKAWALMAIAAVAAALILAWRDRGRLSLFALAVSVAAVGARTVAAPDDPATGLLAAAPALVLALGWLRGARIEHRWVIAALAVFVAGLAGSIYADGGSIQWGGRFLSPVLGPVAAMAGVAIWRLVEATSVESPRLVAGCVAGALLVVQGASAVIVPNELRKSGEAAVGRIAAQGELVVLAHGGQAARLDWRAWRDRCWIAIPEAGDVAQARATLDVLEQSGIHQGAFAGVDPQLLRDAGATVAPAAPGSNLGTFTLPGHDGERDVDPRYACAEAGS